ncbi:hypothetical protein J7M22_01500 [Candidatus Poribacteria bacterium]|nr:hypothetical protein [Candidatus Poribacteria bacterium]
MKSLAIYLGLVLLVSAMAGCAIAPHRPIGTDVSYVRNILPFSQLPLTMGEDENGEIYGTPDEDGDGIKDNLKAELLELVRKFCPTLVLDISDTGGVLSRPLFPMPVETFARKLTVDRFSIAPFRWKGRDMTDLSEIDDRKLSLLSEYFTRRVRIKPDDEMKVAFFDFPGDSPDEWLWALNVIQWMEGYKPTVYAHPFILKTPKGDRRIVIQYWYLFPFDGWGKVHEGDWEHVNVIVTSLDPKRAQLLEVQFYFQGFVTSLSNVELDGLSHPVIYVGGGAKGSHGMYPYHGKWLGMKGGKGAERVYGNFRVSYRDFDVNLIPDAETVKLEKMTPKERGRIIWLKLDVRWGRPWIGGKDSAIITLRADSEGYAPFGPAFSTAWNRSGECLGYEVYRPKVKSWLELLPTSDIIEHLITGQPVFENAESR